MKKPEKNLPDTNAIIRYLVADEPQMFKKAKAFFDGVKKGDLKAIILESVVAESIYVLTKIYHVPRAKAAASLIDILHYKGVANEDQQELISALSLYAGQRLDIVDCILYAKASSNDHGLFTFDEELKKPIR